MIVVDASAVVEFLLRGPRGEAVGDLLEREAGRTHAPAEIDLEVAQVLRRLESEGRLEPDRATAAIELMGLLPVVRHSHTELLPRIWTLRANLTAYDAAYVALAEALDCPLVTLDRKIEKAPGVVIEILIPG